jgi:Mg-chelatase subunit ChlD
VVDDERVIRDFRSFTRSAPVKLDVIVLFDSSESVLPHFKQEMTEVLQLISRWPWNPDDVSVLSFSGMEAHSVCAADCRTSLTADRVASLPTGGTTPLFDALDTATSLLSKRAQPDVWPVIILFSDGDDTISKESFNRVLEKTLASEEQVYAIDVNTSRQPSNGTAILQKLANDSGGRCIRMGEDAARIFSEVIDDLHSARVVTYALTPSASDFHSVHILPTHNLNLQFRSRRGYYQHMRDTR